MTHKYRGLGITKLQFSFKKKQFFKAENIFHFLVIKTLDPDPHLPEFWIRIRLETNADPKQCFQEQGSKNAHRSRVEKNPLFLIFFSSSYFPFLCGGQGLPISASWWEWVGGSPFLTMVEKNLVLL
jgi:hypothetical protein